jgi:hypothetical protein
MRSPFAIGAVVLGWPSTFQIPLSGQISPVLALVPRGFRAEFDIVNYSKEVVGETAARERLWAALTWRWRVPTIDLDARKNIFVPRPNFIWRAPIGLRGTDWTRPLMTRTPWKS